MDTLYDEVDEVKGAIALLKTRTNALEAQLASLEPTLEARSSRTEKMVMELQLELARFMKLFGRKEEKESQHQVNVEKMLAQLLERTAGM